MAIEIKRCSCGCVCQVDNGELVKMHGGDMDCRHKFADCEKKPKTFDYYCAGCHNFFEREPKHICPHCGLIGTIRSRIAASKAEELSIGEQAKIIAEKFMPLIKIIR